MFKAVFLNGVESLNLQLVSAIDDRVPDVAKRLDTMQGFIRYGMVRETEVLSH